VTITQKDSPLFFSEKNQHAKINSGCRDPSAATEPVNGLSFIEISGHCLFARLASSADEVKIQYSPVVL